MRRILFFLMFILLIPFTAFAEECRSDGVTIQSIEMVDKSTGSSELTKARGRSTLIDLDLSFSNVDDYIKYKVTVKNNTDVDYVLDESMFNKKYSNVSYTFETDSKTVKANQTRDLTLNVQLINTPGKGLFNETNTFNINLTGGKIENPNTGIKSLLYYIPVIVIIGLTIALAVKRNKAFKVMVMIIGLIVSVPFIVKAACKCNLTIISTVTVENCKYKLVTDQGSFNNGSSEQEVCLGTGDVKTIGTLGANYIRNVEMTYSASRPYAYMYLRNNDSDSREPFFNDNSYIMVYSDAAKTNLIKTITKNDINERGYVLTSGKYTDSVTFIELGKYENVYLDVSNDLRNKAVVQIGFGRHEDYKDISNFYPEEYLDQLVVTNEDIINKINTLAKSNTERELISFTNCSDDVGYDAGATDQHFASQRITSSLYAEPILTLTLEVSEPTTRVCSGNIYHAVWDSSTYDSN